MRKYAAILFILTIPFVLFGTDGMEGKKKRDKYEEYVSQRNLKDIPLLLYQLKFTDDSLISFIEDVPDSIIDSRTDNTYLYFSNDTVAVCSGPCADTLCKDVHVLGYMMIGNSPLIIISKTLFPKSISFENAINPKIFLFSASYGSIIDSLAPVKCIIVAEDRKHNI